MGKCCGSIPYLEKPPLEQGSKRVAKDSPHGAHQDLRETYISIMIETDLILGSGTGYISIGTRIKTRTRILELQFMKKYLRDVSIRIMIKTLMLTSSSDTIKILLLEQGLKHCIEGER